MAHACLDRNGRNWLFGIDLGLIYHSYANFPPLIKLQTSYIQQWSKIKCPESLGTWEPHWDQLCVHADLSQRDHLCPHGFSGARLGWLQRTLDRVTEWQIGGRGALDFPPRHGIKGEPRVLRQRRPMSFLRFALLMSCSRWLSKFSGRETWK